jgi:prepilin-type N-terminal cleavage/methylation domain-containing protein/prepilin-type processing-associated H-X9-DG protein
MLNKKAFSLIELLVVMAVVAVLLSILAPALGRARRQVHRVTCAARCAQLGHAFHMYAGDHRGLAMPLGYTDPAIIGDGPPIYWWGTNSPTGVDHTKGFVWPYLRSDLRDGGVYECPAQPWGTYVPQGAAKAVTSTYGYNGYYLCPPHTPGWSYIIRKRPWQNISTLHCPAKLFVFADTLIDLAAHKLPQNNALLDPPLRFTGRQWVRNTHPTTAFRHDGRACVLLADGHVEALTPGDGEITSRRFGIGSVGSDNDPHYVPDWREW